MGEHATILLVEDNPDDAALLRRAFIKARVLNPIHVVSGGEEAIDYLSGLGKYANREEFPFPGLVLLDLNMPGLDGFDVLQWIRQEPQLNRLRVVVLSASDNMRDVSRAYKLGANSFLIKPADFDRFVEISQALNGYWIWLDKAPAAGPPSGAPSEIGDVERPGTIQLPESWRPQAAEDWNGDGPDQRK